MLRYYNLCRNLFIPLLKVCFQGYKFLVQKIWSRLKRNRNLATITKIIQPRNIIRCQTQRVKLDEKQYVYSLKVLIEIKILTDYKYPWKIIISFKGIKNNVIMKRPIRQKLNQGIAPIWDKPNTSSTWQDAKGTHQSFWDIPAENVQLKSNHEETSDKTKLRYIL